MRVLSRFRSLHLALLACIGGVGLAPAVSIAIILPVEMELRVEVWTLPAVVLTSRGAVQVNGSQGGGGRVDSLTFAGGELEGVVVQPINDPPVDPWSALRLDVANGPGTLARTADGRLGGMLPLRGNARLCLFSDTYDCLQPVANLSVPLSAVGPGGFEFASAAINVTVFGAPWTTGTATATTTLRSMTHMGYARGPLSGVSSTARAGGEIQLVTPIFLSTNIAPAAVIPVYGILTLHFVPEPTTLLLLGGGVIALATAGRSRLP